MAFVTAVLASAITEPKLVSSANILYGKDESPIERLKWWRAKSAIRVIVDESDPFSVKSTAWKRNRIHSARVRRYSWYSSTTCSTTSTWLSVGLSSSIECSITAMKRSEQLSCWEMNDTWRANSEFTASVRPSIMIFPEGRVSMILEEKIVFCHTWVYIFLFLGISRPKVENLHKVWFVRDQFVKKFLFIPITSPRAKYREKKWPQLKNRLHS